MRADWYLDRSRFRQSRLPVVLIESESLVQPSLTFRHIHHRAIGQQRFRIDIRVDLISRDKKRRGRARRLRSDG